MLDERGSPMHSDYFQSDNIKYIVNSIYLYHIFSSENEKTYDT